MTVPTSYQFLTAAQLSDLFRVLEKIEGLGETLFITPALPKNLQADEIVQIGMARAALDSAGAVLGAVGVPA
jgi:hypothetical protein